jgi:flavin reductase (DIM6/NTAB) family NADH-FMN oxidoreductase RutF
MSRPHRQWPGTAAGPAAPQAIDAEQFREVMAAVPAPVSVVTTLADGRPYGSTVSSFASLSLHPPMVLVSLGARSALLRVLRRANRFACNVLSSGQQRLAVSFARRDTDKFGGVDWYPSADLPRLRGTTAWLACEVEEILTGGDHRIVLGRVVAAEHSHRPPLTYHRRLFGTHTALDGEG